MHFLAICKNKIPSFGNQQTRKEPGAGFMGFLRIAFAPFMCVVMLQEDAVKAEFVFENPNAKGACGCGESFNV
jgi:hypothetical protein